MNRFIGKPLSVVALVVAIQSTAQAEPLAQPIFPPEGWARLANWREQIDECLKIAGKSIPKGMECKFAQAKQLPPLNKRYREWYGEFYDPVKYRKCLELAGQPTELACEFLRLMREPEPEYWPYPSVPRSKWPEAPNPATYKRGMSSKEYFDALCKAEAGEFIYRVVEGVEGVYQVRPRKQVTPDALRDRYVMEDPYGYENWEATTPQTMFALPGRYRFFEKPIPSVDEKALQFKLFAGEPDNRGRYPIEEVGVKVRSRYGFLWRGIRRVADREHAIAGGELVVIDLVTGEVLALRRGFARSGFVENSRSRIQWETAETCPRFRRQPNGWDKWPDFTYFFVSKVLKPAS